MNCKELFQFCSFTLQIYLFNFNGEWLVTPMKGILVLKLSSLSSGWREKPADCER